MTALTLQEPVAPRRTFWEPWVGVGVAALLYFRAAPGQWGGLIALAAELALCVTMHARLRRRTDEELELLDTLLSRDLRTADIDRLTTGASERVQALFATASSALLATGMAASAFLLLFYANDGTAGGGIISVAPKAFVATGYAIVCALAFTREAQHLTATVVDPLRRRRMSGSHDLPEPSATPPPATPSEPPPISRAEALIEELVAMQIAHLQALHETNQLLAASASERVDEESGVVRVKLAKGLSDFRRSVEQLNGIVDSLNARIDGLTNEESALFDRHRRELVGEISRLPQQVIDRTAGMITTSVSQLDEYFRQTLQRVHDDEQRRARDLLASEFEAMRHQFELTQTSVGTIVTRFNDVVSSLDALAAAFDRSAKSVVVSATGFTQEAESLAASVTDALARLSTGDETKTSLLAPLTEAATAVRKASSLVATDMRKVAAERERLGRVRLKILDLLPKEKEQGN